MRDAQLVDVHLIVAGLLLLSNTATAIAAVRCVYIHSAAVALVVAELSAVGVPVRKKESSLPMLQVPLKLSFIAPLVCIKIHAIPVVIAVLALARVCIPVTIHKHPVIAVGLIVLE